MFTACTVLNAIQQHPSAVFLGATASAATFCDKRAPKKTTATT